MSGMIKPDIIRGLKMSLDFSVMRSFYKVLIFVVLAVEYATSHNLGNQKTKRKTFGLPRIIGGHEAEPHSYPYQVGIIKESDAFCGGSLISTSFVLTAAHCLNGVAKENLEIILGAHKIFADEPSKVRSVAAEVIVHENYDQESYQNDIALIKLSQPVELNDAIQTIALPDSAGDDKLYDEQDVISTGWGLTSDRPEPSIYDISDVLEVITLQTINYDSCKASFKKDEEEDGVEYVTRKNICTSGNGITGTCYGDSGGPLQLDGIQIGIVSIGTEECETGAPSIFTRVDRFLDWIQLKAGLKLEP